MGYKEYLVDPRTTVMEHQALKDWDHVMNASDRFSIVLPDGTRGDPEMVPTESRTWDIFGMSCPADAVHIERRLRGIPGVVTLTVNPVTECAYVTYDPSTVTEEELLGAVERLGYRIPALSDSSDRRPLKRSTY